MKSKAAPTKKSKNNSSSLSLFASPPKIFYETKCIEKAIRTDTEFTNEIKKILIESGEEGTSEEIKFFIKHSSIPSWQKSGILKTLIKEAASTTVNSVPKI